MRNRKIAVLLVVVMLFSTGSMGWIFAEEGNVEEIITFQCPELEKLVRETIGNFDAPLVREDVEKIQYLYQRQANEKITSLQGIEALTNLQGLRIKYSSINELGPLSQLTELAIVEINGEGSFDLEAVRNLHRLKELTLIAGSLQNPEALTALADLRLMNLGGEVLGDLSGIGDIQSLQGLDLSYQGIGDISYMESLLNLEYLLLINNELTDLGPLRNSTKLRVLYLMDNRIQSLAPLANLTRLETAYLGINEIEDLRPLFDEKMGFGFPKMESLDLEYNRIPEEQILEYEPRLKEHFGETFTLGIQNQEHSGYGFGYDYFAPTFPDENLEEAVRISVGKPEGLLFYQDLKQMRSLQQEMPIEENKISSLIGIEHLPIDSLNLSGNKIQDLTPLSINRNILELDLSNNNIKDISMLFRDPYEAEPKLVFGNLEKLNLSNNRISVEQQEKYGPYLEEHFGEPFDFGNQIEEVSNGIFQDINLEAAIRAALNRPEGEITEEDLAEIRLLQWGSQDPKEQIRSLEGIDTLRNLKYLSLPHNRIEDLSPLEGMDQLEILILNHNPIMDFSPIGSLTNLQGLELDHTDLENTVFLNDLQQLEAISLLVNNLGSIDALGNMPNLRLAWLGFNRIENLTPISELDKLQNLWISDNEIKDLHPLFNEDRSLKNTNFNALSLHHNRIPAEQIDQYKPVLDEFFQRDYYFGTQEGPGPVEYGRSPLAIVFSDNVLENALRDTLNKDSGIILYDDISSLSRLEWNGEEKAEKIRNLQGIEDLQLQELLLPHNEIEDLSEITRLWRMKELDLRHNKIEDLTPLFTDPYTGDSRFIFDHLEVLHLDGNRIPTEQQEKYGPLLEAHFGAPFDFGVQNYDEPVIPEPELSGQRISGKNRYLTAYEIAKQNNPNPETVILVRGDDAGGVPQVVDGLTASGLAGAKDAQILLTQQHQLTGATKDALLSLQPKKVIIVGGEGAVGSEVVEGLIGLATDGMELEIQRIRGSNRFATAAAVALEIGSARDNTAIIVNGTSEVDSLVAGPLAHKGYPILMVNNGRGVIPEETLSAIEALGIENLLIVGGYGVVSQDLENQLHAIEGVNVQNRYGGAGRVETSIMLAQHEAFEGNRRFSLVNGLSYVDAVSASTLQDPVIYILPRQGITEALETYIKGKEGFRAIGGTGVISKEFYEHVENLIQ